MFSPILKFFRRRLLLIVLWFGRTFLGWGRLDSIDLVELGVPMADVVALYGEPDESKPDANLPEAVVHRFTVTPLHEAVVTEWNACVCAICYWAVFGDSNRDLECMLNKYGQGVGWYELEPGYVCVRNDKKVWLRCSALPAISVETAEYLDAKRNRASV